VVTWVGRVDHDQVAADPDDLVLGGQLVLGHSTIVACRPVRLPAALRLRALGLLR
jgi:hypothetical protein